MFKVDRGACQGGGNGAPDVARSGVAVASPSSYPAFAARGTAFPVVEPEIFVQAVAGGEGVPVLLEEHLIVLYPPP